MAAYFPTFLVLLTLVCGLAWLVDALFLAPKRKQALAKAQAASPLPEEAQQEILKEHAVIETAKSIFPLVAGIMILRSSSSGKFIVKSSDANTGVRSVVRH